MFLSSMRCDTRTYKKKVVYHNASFVIKSIDFCQMSAHIFRLAKKLEHSVKSIFTDSVSD